MTSVITTPTTTTDQTDTDRDRDRALKARHRRMWALGDYPKVARTLIAQFGPRLVEATGITAGTRVLDVAAGAGNVAIPAAAAGARVVASDLTPELFADGRRRAEAAGVDIEWVEADAEDLPFEDGEFDVVVSAVGAMFTPYHQRTAAELLRVTRPGGVVGMVNWTPQGFIGQLFKVMGPYAPPPPPGAGRPPQWGDEGYVRGLLGDRLASLELTREAVGIDAFDDPLDLREFFKEHYGPTIATYANLAGDPERAAALDRDFADLVHTANLGGPAGPARYEWEYLLVVGRTPA